ncbi:MAG TPA: antitoxin family protein [Pirellulaceae bacterium]|jgi:predicted DNA-binding antitoxin AbrB/MazE fold protein
MPKTIHAIFEHGVFRPLEDVLLPEACEVEFEPRVIDSKSMAGIFKVLSERYSSGEHDVAERHNEHQP